MLDPPYIDEEHRCRSSPQFSMMFWNLANWCRKSFDKCPVPERLQRFTTHIDYNLDGDHNPIGDDKPQFNNYFINVIKNFGGTSFHELRSWYTLASQSSSRGSQDYHLLQ